MINDAFPDSLVEVWVINTDVGLDWLLPFRQQYNLHLPILYDLGEKRHDFHLGREYQTLEPLYIVIDQRGIVHYREWGRDNVEIPEIVEIIEGLLEEN